MQPVPFLLPGLAAALLLAAAVAAGLADRRRQLHALLAARAQRDQARANEAAAVRVLRLAAIELRGPATTLLGHADRLCADGGPVQAGATIGAIARQVLDLADDLQHHALADAASRVLRDEPTRLAAMLNEAIAAVRISLEPGRRHWRLPPDLDAIELMADRRALGQILARVLGNAARFSRLDDWIDISFALDRDRFALIVADEGSGLVAAEAGGVPGRAGSRGLGLGLALARVLMEAHGGGLLVEAVPSVGTRVTLDFPMGRLLRMALSPPAGVPADPPVGTQAGTPVGTPAGTQAGALGGTPAGTPAGTPVGTQAGTQAGALGGTQASTHGGTGALSTV